jgi:prepilin-type N-terminal cleavage/methylation domain-containing protein/prepilin-type processing-associated H-X9-DG protein
MAMFSLGSVRSNKEVVTLRRGFTLIELLVVIAIIAILAAILFPVFAQARAKARQTACLSGQKQIGLGLMQYAQDFDETLPMGNYSIPGGPSANNANVPKWNDMIYPYVKNTGVFNCPTNIENSLDYVPCNIDTATMLCTNRTGYRLGTFGLNGANYRGTTYSGGVPIHNPIAQPLANVVVPASTVFMTEVVYGNAGYNNSSIAWDSDVQNPYVVTTTNPPNLTINASGGAKVIAPLAHNGGTNVLWCDGHAKWSSGNDLVATHTVNGYAITYLWTIEDD